MKNLFFSLLKDKTIKTVLVIILHGKIEFIFFKYLEKPCGIKVNSVNH